MAARTTRQAARARIRAAFEKALDQIIPEDGSVPLRDRTFIEWEDQADAFDRAATSTLLEERAALEDTAAVAKVGLLSALRVGSAVLAGDRTEESGTSHTAQGGVIGDRYNAEQDRQAKERAQSDKDVEEALIKARQEWEAAIAEAKQKRLAAESNLPGVPTLPVLPGIGDMLDKAAKISVAGTFNASALFGLGTGNAADRTAKMTEETAKNTKTLINKLDYGGSTFA